MNRTKLQKLMALFLAVLTIAGTFAVPVMAADAGTETDKNEGTSSRKDLAEISAALNAISYLEYCNEHKDAVRANKEVTIDASVYNKEMTDAAVEVYKDYEGMEGDSLFIPDSGKVTWDVKVPETGKYAIEVVYYPISNKANSIERMFYINDEVPFAEARYLAMTKIWRNDYKKDENGNDVFLSDINGNDIRPETYEDPDWVTTTFIDSNGYYSDPFEFFFEEGENTIALEAVREPVVIKSIRLYPYEDLPTYEEVKAQYAANGYKEATADPIKVNAEFTSATSHQTIYPIYDRTSSITDPQDPVLVKLNTIGSDKWQQVGQWIEYDIEVPADGLYTIAARFKQSELSGLYVSRRLYIDGEIPFEECNYLQFAYSNSWQSKRFGENEEGDEPYQFYLTKGKHTIRLEVTLGELGTIVRDVSDTLEVINDAYLSILKLTGTNPDSYRDYGFSRVIPGTIKNLVLESRNLETIINQLESMNGVAGENTATLSEVQRLVEKMASDEDEIAPNLTTLKSNVGTLGTWVNTVTKQPLEIDYLSVQPISAELPKAEANFFQAIWFEIRSFIGSFYTDYNSLGSTVEVDETNSVDVWVVTGRDQAQIIRNLIDNNFTPQSGVAVNLKLVAGGTLLPSVLAGVGPDVSLFTGDGDVINYAIRGALQGLNDKLCKNCKSKGKETLKYVDGGDYHCDECGADGADNWEIFFDTFEEVTSRFSAAATIPLTLYGETFAIPETQTFPMLFYRKDILADLGLEVPKTWDDVLAMIPVLQYNNMEIGLTADYLTYLYQMGGDLYADNGMRVNLDNNLSLEAFEMMCNMFTMYSLPYSYDFANRFRTGEIPIAISNYTSYNQLVVFATEIAGLWEFTTIPGMLQEDGSINNTAVSGVAGVVIMEGSKHKENAWDFIDWYTDSEFQAAYSNELVAVLGEAGMNPTANIEALEELSWTSDEYKELRAQFDALTAVPNYPGSYIISRYTDFAFKDAYNNKANPTESLLGYINIINKEFSRKREEFNLETLNLGENLAEKRIRQARELIDDFKDADKEKYAKQILELNSAIDTALVGTSGVAEFDALAAVATSLRNTDAALFGDVADFIDDAVAALNSYLY